MVFYPAMLQKIDISRRLEANSNVGHGYIFGVGEQPDGVLI